MEKSKWSKFYSSFLILFALIGLVLTGWLVGHILKYTIPAYQPPPFEINPHIENGYQLEIEGEGTIDLSPERPRVRIYFGGEQIKPWGGCAGNTYFTSLPAKCHTADGQLVRVGGVRWNVIEIPEGK